MRGLKTRKSVQSRSGREDAPVVVKRRGLQQGRDGDKKIGAKLGAGRYLVTNGLGVVQAAPTAIVGNLDVPGAVFVCVIPDYNMKRGIA